MERKSVVSSGEELRHFVCDPFASVVSRNQIFTKKLAYILRDFSVEKNDNAWLLQQELVYWDQIKLNILVKTWLFPKY